MKKNAGITPLYVALLAFFVIAVLGGGALFMNRNTTAPLELTTLGDVNGETSSTTPSIENEGGPPSENASSDQRKVPPSNEPSSPPPPTTQKEESSASNQSPTPIKEPVSTPTANAATSTTQSISLLPVLADWPVSAFHELSALISFPPTVKEIVRDSYAAAPSISISTSDNASYTFIRSSEPYASLAREFADMDVDLVTFKGSSLDITAACTRTEGKTGSWETCVALGKAPSSSDTLVATCMSTTGSCSTDNTFYRVVSSFTSKRSAFIGVAGGSLSDIASKNQDLPEEERIAIPENVTSGYMVLTNGMAGLLDQEIFPDEYATGIYPGSPAEKAGLKAGDIITKINNLDALNIDEVLLYYDANDVVPIVYLRDGIERTTSVTLAAWPL